MSHVRFVESCILCTPRYTDDFIGLHEDVILFFRVAIDPPSLLKGIYYPVNPWNILSNAKLSRFCREKNIEFCTGHVDCEHCHPRTLAHCVHFTCFKLARRLYPSLSVHHLHAIARITNTTLPWQLMPTQSMTVVDSHMSHLFQQEDETTDSGRLLATIQTRLPFELQQMVYRHVSPARRAVATCLWSLARYNELISSSEASYNDSTLEPLRGASPIRRLGVNLTNVLGEQTISEIGAEDRGWISQVTVRDAPIEGVQVAFGSYGVTAVRILYKDGSSSQWVGGQSRKWLRTCRTTNLETARADFDGFKCIGLDFPSHSDEVFSHLDSPLWDHDTYAYPLRSFQVLDMRPVDPVNRVRLRVANYSSLSAASNSIHCLTLFTSINGHSCIQLNGDIRRRINSPTSTAWPITYFFRRGEAVQSLHLLSNVHQGPFVVIVTSLGKTVFFGPHSLVVQHIAGSAPLTSMGNFETQKLVGLCAEPREGCLRSLGAALEPRDERVGEELYTAVNLPKYNTAGKIVVRGFSFERSCVSRATLADVACLRVYQSGRRHVGIYIEHGDGDIEVLGQWDPSDVQNIREVYRRGKGAELDFLTFIMSDYTAPEIRQVNSIRIRRKGASEDDDVPESEKKLDSPFTFVWDDHSKEVSWLFSKDFDYLEYWDGSDVQVNIPSRECLPGMKITDLD